jgi:hypothetical protein
LAPEFGRKIRDARLSVGEDRFIVTLDSGKEYSFHGHRWRLMTAAKWQISRSTAGGEARLGDCTAKAAEHAEQRGFD